MKTNIILQGDCLELFNSIPDNSIDMTFADPPFNLKKKYTKYNDDLEFQDYINWCKKWITEMVRVTKPTGSIILHNIPKWLTYYVEFLNQIACFRHWIAWESPTAPMGKSLQPSHYGILFYTKNEKKSKIYEIRHPHKRDRKLGFLIKDYGGKKNQLHPFGPLVSDVWTDIHRIKHNLRRDKHPCQLPPHLLERLILMTTDEDDIVLDPFAGTGTTAIAAKSLGRKYICFEIDPKYVLISKEKLKQTKLHTKLGETWVSWYLNNIVTVREIDWLKIEKYFFIPKDIKLVEKEKILLKKEIPLLQDII